MLSGAWSRRITEEHRLVHLVDGDDLIILQERNPVTQPHGGQPALGKNATARFAAKWGSRVRPDRGAATLVGVSATR